MSLKENLKNLINEEISINQIYQISRVNKYYKESCIERRLRELTNEGKIAPIKKDGYIIAYKPKNTPTSQICPNLTPTDSDKDILNNQLKDIRSKIKTNWETYAQLREIDSVIRGNNLYLKKITVDKYNK